MKNEKVKGAERALVLARDLRARERDLRIGRREHRLHGARRRRRGGAGRDRLRDRGLCLVLGGVVVAAGYRESDGAERERGLEGETRSAGDVRSIHGPSCTSLRLWH